jgi:hypothetical protein
MFGENSRSKFEIVVQKAGDLFQASCSLFPQAIGVGPNEKEAVEDLADLIAYKMGRVIRGSVKSIPTNADIEQKPQVAPKVAPKITAKKPRAVKKSKDKKSFTFSMPIQSELLKENGLRQIPSPDYESMLMLGLPTFLPTQIPVEERTLSSLIESIIGKTPGMKIEEMKAPDSVMLGIPVSFN